jgi:hypothetical protein
VLLEVTEHGSRNRDLIDVSRSRYHQSTVRVRLTPPFFFPKNVVNCFHE